MACTSYVETDELATAVGRFLVLLGHYRTISGVKRYSSSNISSLRAEQEQQQLPVVEVR
jgi:hypothetical protein